MTTRNAVQVSGGAPRSPRTKGITVTVRLFPEVHGAVLDALARVPCGSRSARVIHLVTIGLMCERDLGTAGGNVASKVATPIRSADAEIRGDDVAFVSALIEGPEG